MNKDNDLDQIKKKKIRAKKRKARELSKRLGVFFTIILLVFVVLSVIMINLTRNNNNDYQRIILSQQSYDSTTLIPKRGEIIDTNGTVLATSKEQYNVILDVKKLLSKCGEEGNMIPQTATVNALNAIFGVNQSDINTYISSLPESQYYVVKRGVSYEEMMRFSQYTTKPPKDMTEDSLYDANVTGVWFEKHYVRYYPQNSLACDVIGFSKSDGVASYGLEEYYNDILTGTTGRKYGYIGDDTTHEETIIPAVDGNTIVSTIDANIQMIVEKYLRQFNDEYANNAREGLGANNIGCIIMRADSGEILAMASYPDFDLNNTNDISHIYSEEQIKQMEEEETLKDAYDKLWKNFCICDTYEPGSVMKPFTVGIGLETGTLTGNESYYCGGSLTIGGYPIHCHSVTGEGWLDVRGAVAQSCNVALMQMAETIGINNFLDFQRIYNIGLRTNIDLAGESRTDALVYNKNTLNETELATASFGQGFNVTMIQMIAGYAALVNGGYYYEPHMVKQILNSSGAVVKNIEPRLLKQVVSNSTSDLLRSYCNSVVTDGTGWRAKPAGYAIGGKTGTAETAPRGTGDYVISFMCHAPADDPEIICYVVIDRPNVSRQDDAKYSSIVSRQILTEVLPYLNIHMTEEVSEKEMQELLELELSVYTNRVEKEDSEEVLGEETKETETGDN